MPRSKTPSFIVELPLRVTPAQERKLAVRLEAARRVYNATLGDLRTIARLMRESREWQKARAMPSGRARTQSFLELRKRFNFREFDAQAMAAKHRRAAFKSHLGAQEAQALGTRAFAAMHEYLLGKRGKPRFKSSSRFDSVSSKSNAAGIRARDGLIHWSGLILQPIYAKKDPDGWENQALQARTKFCRIVRRTIRGRERWFVQLIKEGHSPKKAKHTLGVGEVGFDLGPSEIAVVALNRDAGDEAWIQKLCPNIQENRGKRRRLQRAIDRSRRATNPQNYNEDGTIKKGPKLWKVSRRYKKLRARHQEEERRLKGERKRSHGALINLILAQGNKIRCEKLSYRIFQKNWGRSSRIHGAGQFIARLKRKAEGAGALVEEFPTRTTCLSQICHGCGRKVKKPLSLRIHRCDCGIGPVHRDLYSAFLACCVVSSELDVSQASKAWSAAEPLLRRAASRFGELASGYLRIPQVRASERVVRRICSDIQQTPRTSYGPDPEGRGNVDTVCRIPVF